jgi:SAM-dependent methyltransferase
MRHLSFLARILLNYGSDQKCPFCDSGDTGLTDRKHWVLQLRTCKSCGLMFRWPKETPGFSEKFYQETYSEGTYTTELPDPETLQEFVANNFVGSPKNFADQIGVLKEFLPQGRVLDFGCSWGYGVYQLQQAGYDAFGFEISRPRAEHGRRQLEVEILDSLKELNDLPSQSVDGIFASHVLEHLVSLKETFTLFARILKPSGVVIIMVPNAGGKQARELSVAWPPLINEKHTLALDGKFFEKNLSPFGFKVLTLSDPYRTSEIRNAVNQNSSLSAEGEELMVIGHRFATS